MGTNRIKKRHTNERVTGGSHPVLVLLIRLKREKMMKLTQIILSAITTVCLVACKQTAHKKDIYANIPPLEEIAGVWMHTDTMAMEPSIRNFRGQALVNRDMTSISWFASAPYSGGYHSGTMKVNGIVPMAQLFRWMPWGAQRKGTGGTFRIDSEVRMVPDQDAILWKVEIMNDTGELQHYDIEQDLIGFISRYDGEDWPWPYPYPTLQGKTGKRDDEIVNVIKNIGLKREDYTFIRAEANSPEATLPGDTSPVTWPSDSQILASTKYRLASHGKKSIVVADKETRCFTAFVIPDRPDTLFLRNSGATATWSFELAPGEKKEIRFVMSYAKDQEEAAATAKEHGQTFMATFEETEDTWRNRWKAMFHPGNKLFSGCFPVLETDDSLARKVYYTGPLTLLYLLNTNLPVHEKVFLTGGPRWGATVTFFWDITEWSTLWAVVDPEMMKEHLRSWIKIDPDKHFGQDNYGGEGVGNGYSANYWALFQMIRSYITVSRDYDFLNETVGSETVIAHLTRYAHNWKKLSIYGTGGNTADIYKLADFGSDPWNLLECVPTYIHIVPSFNVGYVWMMRETAKFHEYLGDQEKADEMKAAAGEMGDRVLQLYAGDGVWNSLYPGSKKIEVRHVMDFMFFGRYMSQDLPDSIRKEMVDFADRELMTDHWMRAQSLKDVAAGNSDRPDHGPLGAFDGWPAGTMDALVQMGYPAKALDFYRRIAPVTREGIWSQAHELWGANKYDKNARVRIAKRGWHNRESSSGIAMSQVMLKSFMGFYPGVGGKAVQPEGLPVNFSGSLYNVLYGGAYYHLHADKGKVTMERQESEN